jgi:hypothetical protein
MRHLHRELPQLPFQHEIDQQDHDARGEEKVYPPDQLPRLAELRADVIRFV